jgi:hypothetical protein
MHEEAIAAADVPQAATQIRNTQTWSVVFWAPDESRWSVDVIADTEDDAVAAVAFRFNSIDSARRMTFDRIIAVIKLDTIR